MSHLTDSGFLWLIIRWSVLRTITTLDNEPQSCDEPIVGIFGTSDITALIGLNVCCKRDDRQIRFRMVIYHKFFKELQYNKIGLMANLLSYLMLNPRMICIPTTLVC